MVLSFIEVTGTVWRTSSCSTILPSASKRKMSMPAYSASPGQVWWQCRMHGDDHVRLVVWCDS
ncbi:hypothetical protein ACFVU3_39030 [Streptomyces sp. NPDC058052]|uniref:hypothetical protein n=1 Tax=Streptomyces sp. NPDC058052 TaxID=3346316 RepID=UPI0036EDBD3D